MDPVITDYLSKLELGESQQFKNMGIIPLFAPIDHTPKYLTLKEALENKLLTVKEVDQGGSVPELKVVNKAEIAVLLLDGEEVVGAKQNRVLNTTILLRKKSETIIPVSCTEQGRWSYVSEEFSDSDVTISPKIRMRKAASVSESLEQSDSFESDQSAVWNEINEMSAQAAVLSPTGAMRDVFESRTKDLDEYLKAFKYVPHQKGMLVFIDGEIIGFDIISLESAYEALHPKLVKSYAMDAILQKKGKSSKPLLDKARTFLEEVASSREKRYNSVGHGWDYRFEGKASVGSALVYRKKVIHMAFFRATKSDKVGEMSGPGRRRGFRT